MLRKSALFLFLLVLTWAVPAARLHAQDPSQLLQQFTTLQQQIAASDDPCPFMPRLKTLINEMANLDPQIYAAMKPSLDLLNAQDDGCPTTNSTTTTPSQGTGTVAPPSCVYLGPGNCVPIAQYQKQQAEGINAPPGICPSTGYVPNMALPNANHVMAPVPCQPGTHYGPLVATTASGGYTGVTLPVGYSPGSPQNGYQICPASGFVMVQNGDTAIGQRCSPGQRVSTGGSGTSGGSANTRGFNYNLLTAGDCVLERGHLTLNPDGTGQWTAYIHTNHTTNRDIWHISFSVIDSNGRQIFPIFLGDSPYMYGSPSPTIPWSIQFQFNTSLFRSIAQVRISTSC